MHGRDTKIGHWVVENGAGPIGDEFTSQDERRWMQSQIALQTDHSRQSDRTATLQPSARMKPDVVHLTGVDLHQGRQLQLIDKAEAGIDGL